jgi:hypothetical protein
MAADARDREALDLLVARTFVDCALVALDLDMQTRRLALRVYGALRTADATTVIATLTFFGTSAVAIGGAATSFPQSARIVAIAIAYADDDDAGTVEVSGRAGWVMRFSFEGVAFEEHAAVLASLADDE